MYSKVHRRKSSVAVLMAIFSLFMFAAACGGSEASGQEDATSVTLTPIEDYNSIRTQHTFVALVKDGNGDPVEGTRVEWVLNRAPGLVGDIVCLCGDTPVADGDEKVDNTFGFATTDENGEARLTVTATREGDTDVTAYVPGIGDPGRHKAFAVKRWLDLGAQFPPDAVNASGTSHVMTVQVFRITDGTPLAGIPVRWDLLDGPQAYFGNTSPGTTSAVTSTDLSGSATITLNQAAPVQGVNRVRMSVLAEENPSFVVITRDMTKTWESSILGLTKTGPEQIGLLDEATYEITVRNTGDGNANGVTFTDRIPAGMEFVRSDPASTISGRTVSWNIGSVNAGEQSSVTLVLRGVQSGQWTNTVTATSTEGVSATAQATTRVVPGQLEITKTGPAVATLGQLVTYEVNVTNSGPGALTGVTLVDTMPAGMSYSSSSESGTFGGSQITWNLGTLSADETRSFTVLLRAQTVGSWINTARVVSTDASPKQASVTTRIVQPALSIEKSGPVQATLGADFNYDITVRNHGDGTATAVTITDTLPSGLTFVSASPAATVSGSTVTWNAGTLDSGASKEVTLTVKGNRTGTHENVVVVTAAQPTMDTARASTRIAAPAVSIRKTGPSAVPSGFTRTYVLTVTNTGEVPLNNVAVTDMLPAGLSYSSSVPAGTVSGSHVTWDLGTLAVNQQKSITVVLRGEEAGSWLNVATVDTLEGVSDTSSLSIVVSEAFSGATMSLIDSIDPIAVGEEVTYTIVVENQAVTQDLHSMTITAVLPTEMTFVSASGPATHTVVGQEVRFAAIGTVSPTGVLTFTITVRANAAGSVLFTSTMRYDEFPGPILVQEATTVFQP